MTDYEILKYYGFSPAKAAEIVLDAKRGNRYAAFVLKRVKDACAKKAG